MKKSTVILWLCILVLITTLSNCQFDASFTVNTIEESCGTVEQCEELERLKAMPEFQAARSPASMQP